MPLNLRRLRKNASFTGDVLNVGPLTVESVSTPSGDIQTSLDTHAGLHTAHTASLATKSTSNDGVHTGETSVAALAIGHTSSPNATAHIAGDLIVGSASTAFQVGHDNSNSIYLEGNKPQLVLYESGSVNTDERMWSLRSSNGELSLIARTDNDGSGNTAISFDRSGSAVTATRIGANALVVDNSASPPTVSINGNDVQAQIDANGAALLVERGRLDVLLDAGTSLDQITELRTAWESGDGTLNSAVANLTSVAATDRAAIRSEHAADNSAQSTALTASYVAADAAVSAAYVAADAVVTSAYVAADAAQSTAITNAYVAADGAQTSAITTAYQAADTALTSTLNASIATKVDADDGNHTGQTNFEGVSVGHTSAANSELHVAGSLIVGSASTDFQAGHDSSHSIYLEGDSPQLVLYETGSVNANERMWCFRSSGGEISLIARTDNDGSGNSALTISRSGNTITDVNFGSTFQIDHAASTVSINGYDIQSQITENWTNVDTNTDAIALNTAKNSYTAVASAQVATNVSEINTLSAFATVHTNDIATNVSAISLNTAKNSYTTVASDQVASNVTAIALNTDKISYTTTASDQVASNVTAIALNTAKNSYTDEAQVSTNKSDISAHADLHATHTASLATKAPTHQATFTGDVTINSTSIVGDSGTNIRFNQTNLQLNTHSSGSLSGTAFNRFAAGLFPVADQTYDIGSGSKRFREVYVKDMDASGAVSMSGLPSSDPSVVGQLYVKADGLLRVSSG